MSGQDMGCMDLDAFTRWDVKSLKTFLRKRDLKTCGNKSTLVARAFAAWEQGVEEKPDCAQRQQLRDQHYRKLLETADEGFLPDPLTQVDAWMNEEDGMSYWPPIMLTDISDYLRRHETHTDTASLRTRLLKDYKEQKAYSYFSSQWLFEIKFAEVSPKYCFLAGSCRPSQRISSPPHDVWICSSKDGDIVSAYCTCFAGLGQSCNHVAAVLLKVDFCWRNGLTKKTCTSKPCVWNNRKGQKVVQPRRVCEMEWKKPGALKLDQKKTINPTARSLFQPLAKTTEKGMSLCQFMTCLSVVCPDAVVLKEQKVRPATERVTTKSKSDIDIQSLPMSISQLGDQARSVEDFLGNIPCFSTQIQSCIEESTRGQANNKAWFEQREGSLTASRFRDVYSRVETHKKNNSTDMTAILKSVMGYSAPSKNIPALKYGRRMEADALRQYEKVLKSSGHKDVKCSPCGLFVDMDVTYLRASPDGVVSCKCCGEGLVEVKCPFSTAHLKPSPDTADCLTVDNNGVACLKRKHKYFDQVVGQIMISGRKWCDIFIYSAHGYHIERIYLNEACERWESLKPNLDFFFQTFLAPEIVHRAVKNAITQSVSGSSPAKSVLGDIDSTSLSKKHSKQHQLQRRPLKRLKKSCTNTKLECYICDNICEDISENENAEPSIMCSYCNGWIHWSCANITADSDVVLDQDLPYICAECDS